VLLPSNDERVVDTASRGATAPRTTSAAFGTVPFTDDEEGIRLVSQRALSQAGY
jgi:hypothetical protein